VFVGLERREKENLKCRKWSFEERKEGRKEGRKFRVKENKISVGGWGENL
jgi:hypothetical protein